MIARLFDDAARLGYLHVDLAGAQIESTEQAAADVDEPSSALVSVRLADDSQAQLWLTETPTSRWRVHQVAIDGVAFDESGKIFVDASCGEEQVRVHAGAACPSTETTDWRTNADIVAEVDRRQAEAGEDNNKQIEVAQQIQNLVARATVESDQRICAAIQGNTSLGDGAVHDELLSRAETLIADTCPGSIELLTDPPEVPPSGAEIGERTVYGRLDLSTPEAGVATFGALFTHEAFMMLFFSLDAEAQSILARSINNLDVSTVVDPKVLETWEGVDSEAHYNTLVGNFASLMTEASATGLHLLDLSGPLEIVGTSPLQWTEERGEPVDAQMVASEVPNHR